ncbi:MAG: hypothetical protein ABI615_04010 [Chthoniobacterales bacterium]
MKSRHKKKISIRQILIGLWIALFPLFIFQWNWPVNTMRLRQGIIFVAGCLLAGAIFYIWPYKKWRYGFLALIVVVATFLLLPISRTPDSHALGLLYAQKLLAYKETPYLWDGEGSWGIDAPGLVRRALEDAMVDYGFRTLNPSLIRNGISLWWSDSSAHGIGAGYEGRTSVLMTGPSLNTLDYSKLQPGDMAVTLPQGVYVLAYLGDQTWIAAAPDMRKVTTYTIPEKSNTYFSAPMKTVRWNILNPQ